MSGRRAFAAACGAAAALLPSLVAAQEGSRTLDAPPDAGSTVVVTIAAVAALFAVASLGYLYLRVRGLTWSFQEKELPPEPGSGAHH